MCLIRIDTMVWWYEAVNGECAVSAAGIASAIG